MNKPAYGPTASLVINDSLSDAVKKLALHKN